MLDFKLKNAYLVIAMTAVLAPQALAANISNTYHNDFRSSLKIDVNPVSKNPVLKNQVLKNKISQSGKLLAEQFLSENKVRYGLESNFEDLQFVRSKASLLGEHFYFQQYLGGIPVDKAEIIVSLSKQNEVIRVFNNTFPVSGFSPLVSKNLIGTETAEVKVWDHLQVSGKLQTTPRSKLTYVNLGKDFKLTYKVNMTVTQPFGDWEFYIDANNGAVINAQRIDLPISKNANAQSNFGKWFAAAKNIQQKSYAEVLAAVKTTTAKAKLDSDSLVSANKVDATGLVFDPDPVTTLSNENLEDTSLASNFDAAYFTKTLKDLTLDNGTYRLVGPWVTIADFESPNTAPSTTTDGIWDAKRGDNAFNDAMTYFHIDQNQRYIQSLGFVGATGIQEVSISVDTDGVDGEDNSHFIPGANQLAFGHGCVDDNEDTDVILHEYGHAINWSINNSFGGGDTGAMGEGFGDYWAASYSYSTPNGRSFHPEWAFSWDGHNLCWGGRRLDQTSFRYNPSTTYTAHGTFAGVLGDELWSTPLVESLLTLLDAGVPRSEVDQIILEAQFGLGSGLKMPDMAAAIISTAVALFPNGDHAETFKSNFKMMEILGESLTLDELSIVLADDDMIAEPGETVSFNVSLKNTGGTALSNISGILTSSTANVTIGAASTTFADANASQIVTSDSAFELTVPANHSCGSDIQLSMATTYTDGTEKNGTVDFTMPVGSGNEVTQSSSPGTAIPDENPVGITDQLTVSGAVDNTTISVDMNITHTYRGDLTLTLTSPEGTSVIIQTSSGDGTANIIGNYPNDLTPENSLSAFDGEDHNGVWSLKVVDSGPADLGTLNSWAIISTSPSICNGNSAPVAAVASTSIQVNEGASVSLNASSSSDINGDPLTFAWTQTGGTAVTLNNASSDIASFTAPQVNAAINLSFEVTVTDPSGSFDTETVNVTVNNIAEPDVGGGNDSGGGGGSIGWLILTIIGMFRYNIGKNRDKIDCLFRRNRSDD